MIIYIYTFIAVTLQQTNTAIKIAKPSIQAKDRWSSVAVDTPITIETIEATNKILIIKSYRYSHSVTSNACINN